MNPNGNGNGKRKLEGILRHRDATAEEIRDSMNLGVMRALREHKRLGNPIVVWDYETKQVVTIPPEEIDVPDEVDESAEASSDQGS